MNITSEKITVRDLLALKMNDLLKVNAEYQRGAVWSEPQQKKLIDSVMRNYPLPLIYLHHKTRVVAGYRTEGLEIIDGQQRINALHKFGENALKLFDPVKDDKAARFPSFIKAAPCPWAHCTFLSLPAELRDRFLNTELFLVKITTGIDAEARDLFIRLQAGLPLNAQEKRDAWPGGFTELVLTLGGKPELTRYPGHEFFTKLVKASPTDRGAVRQLCAQICVLFFENAARGNWQDIGTQHIDDYYYRHLDFDIKAPIVDRLVKVLDLAVQLFASQAAPKLKGHEAIHVVLLLDALINDYTKSWHANWMSAYDSFKELAARHKKDRSGEYWHEYGALTQTQSAEGRTIQRRHAFFQSHMLRELKPQLLDGNRVYGEVEREIVYYRDKKRCGRCDKEIIWNDLEIHHVHEHHAGGQTSLENAAAVHSWCHPLSEQDVKDFAVRWEAKKPKPIDVEKLFREFKDIRGNSEDLI